MSGSIERLVSVHHITWQEKKPVRIQKGTIMSWRRIIDEGRTLLARGFKINTEHFKNLRNEQIIVVIDKDELRFYDYPDVSTFAVDEKSKFYSLSRSTEATAIFDYFDFQDAREILDKISGYQPPKAGERPVSKRWQPFRSKEGQPCVARDFLYHDDDLCKSGKIIAVAIKTDGIVLFSTPCGELFPPHPNDRLSFISGKGVTVQNLRNFFAMDDAVEIFSAFRMRKIHLAAASRSR